MIDVVVFDMDGVIVDSEQVWDDVREQLAAERGGRWHDGAQAAMMGMSSPEWSAYMHDEIGLRESPAEINAEVVERMLERYREDLPLIDGAVEAVRRLAPGSGSASRRPRTGR
jgi:beta-phosphoglucomutase-like phosphatase (HAD superfamily)